jgi:hypothetical protein
MELRYKIKSCTLVFYITKKNLFSQLIKKLNPTIVVESSTSILTPITGKGHKGVYKNTMEEYF